MLSGILLSLNDIITGSPFETLPSTMLKLEFIVFGTGVWTRYWLLLDAEY